MREVQRENREDLAVTVFELAAAFSNAADTNGNMACTIPTHRNTYKVTSSLNHLATQDCQILTARNMVETCDE